MKVSQFKGLAIDSILNESSNQTENRQFLIMKYYMPTYFALVTELLHFSQFVGEYPYAQLESARQKKCVQFHVWSLNE